MEIQKANTENGLSIALSGRLDTGTAPQLEEAVEGELDGINELTVDLAETEYISSAGLRVLLEMSKTMQEKGGMTVKNANEPVMEIFKVTGFDRILNIV